MISRSPFLIILITGLRVAGRLNYLIFWINIDISIKTGIESDEQYYELQKQVYGDVIIDLSWLI